MKLGGDDHSFEAVSRKTGIEAISKVQFKIDEKSTRLLGSGRLPLLTSSATHATVNHLDRSPSLCVQTKYTAHLRRG